VDAPLDVVAVGDCGLDLYAEVPTLPRYDEKVPATYVGTFGGGVAANFACAAARLGLRTALLSVVGEDPFGDAAVASVAEHGVDVTGVRRRGDAHTHFCFVCLDGRGEKALTIVRTAAFFPRWEDLDLSSIDSTRVVHVAPFELDTATRVATHASRRGVAVTLDLEPGSTPATLEPLSDLLATATIAMPNQQCLSKLFPGAPVDAAARELRARGPEIVVVTRGAEGALVATSQGAVAVDAFAVEARDTTGAGDTFNAAFLARWLAGDDPVVAARFAAAAAALSIQAFGARGLLPSVADVVGFQAAHSERSP
jgi:sugar/nucleoside kinase (ribokinase family)